MTDKTRRRGNGQAAMTTVPAWRILPALVRNPLKALVDLATDAAGGMVELRLGPERLYLLSDPAQVAHVLRDNAGNYRRDGRGLLWGPIKRLFGEGVLGEGPVWAASRQTLQPLFAARRLDALADDLADAIGEASEPLDAAARQGHSVDIGAELCRIVCRAMVRVLFADRFSTTQALRITAAQDVIATAVLPRLLLPFVPEVVPLPGDRPFRRAVREIDGIVLPVVRQARADPSGDDVVATLARGHDAQGRPLSERQLRNDTVAMFATSTETTYGVLTCLWPMLARYPQVARRLTAEIDEVVGSGPVRGRHLPRLRYTRMVLDELLRLFPVGWLVPRTATNDDVIGGVALKAGAQVLISPYLTHRLPSVWPQPLHFDPDRFDPDRVDAQQTDPRQTDPRQGVVVAAAAPRRRARYAHFPFGGGPHQCLGQYLFYLEATLIVATILSRFQVTVPDSRVPELRPGAALRASRPVRVLLRPHTANRVA
ncbi:cytochrome P450 [Solwaraspora sp. WMMB335]|uniref:cytochrome P450 n=1 Tax=Solwaraspora sp. WMMB335 TaxID=3404118 RepID=UPI003B94AC40